MHAFSLAMHVLELPACMACMWPTWDVRLQLLCAAVSFCHAVCGLILAGAWDGLLDAITHVAVTCTCKGGKAKRCRLWSPSKQAVTKQHVFGNDKTRASFLRKARGSHSALEGETG
jgi:hypothetical protein